VVARSLGDEEVKAANTATAGLSRKSRARPNDDRANARFENWVAVEHAWLWKSIEKLLAIAELRIIIGRIEVWMPEKTNVPSILKSLIVDSTGSDTEEVLFKALQNRISFEKTTGRLLPRQGLFELDGRRRLIALFLARQARGRLELPRGAEQANATELASESQMPVKTCREYLSRLKSIGIIERRGNGYYLPEWNILRAAEEILKKNGGDTK
jgi:hypothetical protein